MLNYNIYDDIATRTGGDIYIGVVGPVRTGKSTFIKKFMELNVLDKITDKNKRARMVDELPQSADGKTIMTTEPKFVPNEAVTVTFDKIKTSVRLIDCVGYVVEGALGQMEDDKPRMVKTPWVEEEIPFEKAAEIGTKKVICDHSTVGIMVTTDGTITEIGRAKYVEAEEKAVEELKSCGKPFIVLINSKTPESTDSIRLKESLQERYGVPVVLCDIMQLTQDSLCDIMEKILLEFPVRCIRLNLPKWMRSLPFEGEIMSSCINMLRQKTADINKMVDCENLDMISERHDLFVSSDTRINSSTGSVEISCVPDGSVYYSFISSETGQEINDDYSLMKFVCRLARSYKEYEGIRLAMEQVQDEGYGVVTPSIDQMEMCKPELVKKGNQYGVKIKAGAPSYHIVRVDVETEISPTIGSAQQTQELVKSMLNEYENDKNSIWQTNMFGMSVGSLVKDDLQIKLGNIPIDTRKKLRKTMTRIVNEGKGGVLCILL